MTTQQDSTSVEKNKTFFSSNDAYQANVETLDTYRFIREVANREVTGINHLLDVGNGGVFDYDPALVNSIVAVDLFLEDVPDDAFPPNVTARQSDALDLAETSDTYDGVFMALLLHHLVGATPKDLLDNVTKAITEAHRVLKPGGKLIVIESCVSEQFYRAEQKLFPLLARLSRTPLMKHPPTLQLSPNLLNNLIGSYFNIERAERIPVGRWIMQFGKRWPTRLTPARPYLIVATK
jgi:SAM-dependent methyltransferase